MEWRKLAEEAIEGAGAGAGPYDVGRTEWHKALLYVLGAVAAMMAFLGFTSALLLCVWCRCRTSTTAHANTNANGGGSGSGGDRNMNSSKTVCDSEIGQTNCAQDDAKVLVVMPGHTLPTFIATLFLPHPLPSAAASSPPSPSPSPSPSPCLAAAAADGQPQPPIHPV